jgi:hypothetical protein
VRWIAPITTETAAGVVLSDREPPPDLADLMPRIARCCSSGACSATATRLSIAYRAAGGPTTSLWEIPGGGHTGGIAAEPATYERRVIGFFDRAAGRRSSRGRARVGPLASAPRGGAPGSVICKASRRSRRHETDALALARLASGQRPRMHHDDELEVREVRSDDPSLSQEANRLLTEELREAVGADRVRVPRGTPRKSERSHGGRGGLAT